MEDCIFCKIVKNEIPATRVYEDDDTLAFLDIKPINPGHILVITKKHVPFFYQLDDEHYLKLMQTVNKVARALDTSIPSERVGLLAKGFDIDHVHIHVFPQHSNENIQATTPHISPSSEELAQTAAKIKDAIK